MSKPDSSTPGKPLRVHQVAKRLQVSTRTIYRWIAEGLLPNAYRVGGGWRVPQSDLQIVIKLPEVREGENGELGGLGEDGELSRVHPT